MSKKINYLKSKFFSNKKISYGFFSRNGGFSSNPYNTLNCSLSDGDLKKNVKKNIKLATSTLNIKFENLIIGNQYHSNKVIIIHKTLNKKYKGDGFVTKNKNIAFGILTADCAPILFYDEKRKIIGAAHAGWRGCFKNICNSVIISMKKLGSNNCDIKAIIGPCINYKNYDVNENMYVKFIKKNNNYDKFFRKKSKSKYNFNLKAAIEYQLKNLKIKKIIKLNKDTYSNKSKYFSHRRSFKNNEIKTGRMINIIGFAKNN